MITALSLWSRRRWLVASLTAAATLLIVGLPTALIPSPVFGREVAPTPWAWPVLLLTSCLSGLLFATYLREPHADGQLDRVSRAGTVGGLLTYFAVGCPVCNKLALIALGYSGALQWFAPIQPFLAVIGVVLLGWALRVRLRGEIACPVPTS